MCELSEHSKDAVKYYLFSFCLVPKALATFTGCPSYPALRGQAKKISFSPLLFRYNSDGIDLYSLFLDGVQFHVHPSNITFQRCKKLALFT